MGWNCQCSVGSSRLLTWQSPVNQADCRFRSAACQLACSNPDASPKVSNPTLCAQACTQSIGQKCGTAGQVQIGAWSLTAPATDALSLSSQLVQRHACVRRQHARRRQSQRQLICSRIAHALARSGLRSLGSARFRRPALMVTPLHFAFLFQYLLSHQSDLAAIHSRSFDSIVRDTVAGAVQEKGFVYEA